MEAQLKARIAELRLQESVTLTGGLPHEEVLRRMARSDLFVLPSWGEGYGIVYIEAMAAGASPSARKTRALPTPSRTARTAFLCPPPTRTRWKRSCALCSPIQKRMKRCGRAARATRAD